MVYIYLSCLSLKYLLKDFSFPSSFRVYVCIFQRCKKNTLGPKMILFSYKIVKLRDLLKRLTLLSVVVSVNFPKWRIILMHSLSNYSAWQRSFYVDLVPERLLGFQILTQDLSRVKQKKLDILFHCCTHNMQYWTSHSISGSIKQIPLLTPLLHVGPETWRTRSDWILWLFALECALLQWLFWDTG